VEERHFRAEGLSSSQKKVTETGKYQHLKNTRGEKKKTLGGSLGPGKNQKTMRCRCLRKGTVHSTDKRLGLVGMITPRYLSEYQTV